jgi:hypothetical protein
MDDIKASCVETLQHEFQFDRFENDMSVFRCNTCPLEVIEYEDSGTGA